MYRRPVELGGRRAWVAIWLGLNLIPPAVFFLVRAAGRPDSAAILTWLMTLITFPSGPVAYLALGTVGGFVYARLGVDVFGGLGGILVWLAMSGAGSAQWFWLVPRLREHCSKGARQAR